MIQTHAPLDAEEAVLERLPVGEWHAEDVEAAHAALLARDSG